MFRQLPIRSRGLTVALAFLTLTAAQAGAGPLDRAALGDRLQATAAARTPVLSDRTRPRGELEIRLHDAPAPEVAKVLLAISEVSVHSEADGWTLVSDVPLTVDLLALQDGVTAQLGLTTLPAGSYQQVRLLVSEASVELSDGRTEPLRVPSGDRSGVKLVHGFRVVEGERLVLTLDWDVGAHLVLARSGEWILRPVLRVSAESVAAPSGVLDLDGDGLPDFLLDGRTDLPGLDDGRMVPYLNAGLGLNAQPGVEFEEPPPHLNAHGFATGLNLGDLDGDGRSDVAVSAWFDGEGVHVVRGGPGGLEALPVQSLQNPLGPVPAGSFGRGYGRALAHADVDGDGVKDLIVGSRGLVHVHRGGAVPGPFSALPDWQLASPVAPFTVIDEFGIALAAGDFDGDGDADLAVGAYRTNFFDGAWHLFAGGPAGPSPAPALSVFGSGPDAVVGTSFAVGDFNADGLDDLAVSAPLSDSLAGRVAVHHGSAAGLAATPSTVLFPPAAGYFGTTLANVGDYDGDGIDDLVATDTRTGTAPSHLAHVFAGSPAGLGPAPLASLQGPGSLNFSLFYTDQAPKVIGLGDLDGDGRGEVLVGQEWPGTFVGELPPVLHLFAGGPAGLRSSPQRVLSGQLPSGTTIRTEAMIGFDAGAR